MIGTFFIFVWSADGDMGEGTVLGPFSNYHEARNKADDIWEATEADPELAAINAMIVDKTARNCSGETIARRVVERS